MSRKLLSRLSLVSSNLVKYTLNFLTFSFHQEPIRMKQRKIISSGNQKTLKILWIILIEFQSFAGFFSSVFNLNFDLSLTRTPACTGRAKTSTLRYSSLPPLFSSPFSILPSPLSSAKEEREEDASWVSFSFSFSSTTSRESAGKHFKAEISSPFVAELFRNFGRIESFRSCGTFTRLLKLQLWGLLWPELL